MKKYDNSHQHIYAGVIYMIIALLFFLSIIQGPIILEDDFQRLINADLSFQDVFTLNFPFLDNFIGPFGAYFGFILYLLLGIFFSYCLLAAVFFIGFTSVFYPNRRDLLTKGLLFILFGFFINIFLVSIVDDFSHLSGFLINSFTYVLENIFNTTGTAIISVAFSLAFLVAILETDTVNKIFSSLKYFIFSLLRSLFKPVKKSKVKQSKRKAKTPKTPSVKNKFNDDNKSTKLPKDPEPSIVNHKDSYDKDIAGKSQKEQVHPKNFNWPADNGFDTNLANNNEQIEDKSTSKNSIKTVAKADKSNHNLPSKGVNISQGQSTDSDTYIKPDIESFLHSQPILPYKNREKIEKQIKHTSRLLIDKLSRLGIEAEVVNVNVGPVITQFELLPAPDVKVSRFNNVSSDLSLAIKAKSIRVQAPIPEKGLVGVEIPNRDREIIYLKDVLASPQMVNQKSKLAIALGKDIVGNPVVADLSKMPHLLIAGSTGSGKSVCVNAIICNLLFRTEPEEMRLVLIDPKKIELSGYEGIPHLIQNIVSDHEEALSVLQWAVNEMERRYELLREFNVRDIDSYNKKISRFKDTEEKVETLPYIILVIDEFADLILKSGRDVEMPITRLAQMARAIGIHLIIATQRPSMKIITGLIKANFPAKIAFRVAQKVDSRVILDMNGAESLLGSGDMLFITPTKGLPERIHGAFVSDEEIENLVEYLRTQPKPEQEIEFTLDEGGELQLVDYDDELFPEAAKVVISAGTASVSMLQRHFKIGYARAGRLIDMLEQAKIIGKHVGSKSREVIATNEILEAYNIKV